MWLNELWRRWMGQTPRQLRRRFRSSPTRMSFTVETLEDRTLLSAVSTTDELIAAINNANSAGSATITLASGTLFNFASADNSTNGANALPVITGKIVIVG